MEEDGGKREERNEREEKGCTCKRKKKSGENGNQGQKWEEGSGQKWEEGSGKKRKMEKEEEEQAQDRQDNDPIPSSEERWASS